MGTALWRHENPLFLGATASFSVQFSNVENVSQPTQTKRLGHSQCLSSHKSCKENKSYNILLHILNKKYLLNSINLSDRFLWVFYELKLVRTSLNYRVLGTSMNILSMHLYTLNLGWTSCFISFVWDLSTCQECVESDIIQNEKLLPRVGLEPTTLRFDVWCSANWSNGTWWEMYYSDDLYTSTYFRLQCIHWYKFENEVERILSCKCTVLCYILEYIYTNIQIAKGRSQVLCLILPYKRDQHSLDLVFACWTQT